MLATEEQTAFTLQELIEHFGDDSPAVEAAKQLLREWQTDDGWYKTSLDEWKDALESMGFEDVDISFEGFSYQGNGASFTAGVDLGKLLLFMVSDLDESSDYHWAHKAINHKPCNGAYVWMWHVLESEEFDGMICAKIDRTDHHYSHKYTCKTEWDVCSAALLEDEINALLVSFMGEVEHLRLRLCDAIYKALEEDYDYLTSDEAILERAEANEYNFDEDGDLLT